MATPVLVFKKIEIYDKTKYSTFYSHSKAVAIINESDVNDVLESINTTISSNIHKLLRNISGWIIDSLIDHNINILTYNLLAGNSYIKLAKKLDHLQK